MDGDPGPVELLHNEGRLVAAGLEVTVQDDAQPKPLDDDLSALLFRSVRELLFNVVKHTRAAQTRISLHRDHDQLRIEVSDEGPGFDPMQAMDDETLRRDALEWATTRGGRSGRVAWQFARDWAGRNA